MSKVQIFSEIAPNIAFPEFNFYELYYSTFEKSELGRIKKLLPLREMAENFGLVRKSMRPKLGRKSFFTSDGKVALMFLKMYTGLSCPKLLWEGVEKSYVMMCELSSRLGLHRPRTKFLDVQKANLTYRKQRKHSRSQTRKITRRLLDLLGKILKEIREIERGHENAENLLTVREKSDLEIITRMYRQQKNHFRNNDSRESIPNRIVSLSKPHLRPIVRGKEVKSVEFGAKVNNILVDGISFIEKLSFNAFNEGTLLMHCLKMHKKLFGIEAKKVGGDTGYAGTENRDYCKANGIQTSFVKRVHPFGEKKKEKDLVRKELARVRATAMKGSFGTQKEHYDLRRVKARTKRTEILYIFFGIHMANVVQLSDRIEQRAHLAAA